MGSRKAEDKGLHQAVDRRQGFVCVYIFIELLTPASILFKALRDVEISAIESVMKTKKALDTPLKELSTIKKYCLKVQKDLISCSPTRES